MKYNNIVIISGPSGAGEDSVIDGIAKQTTVNRVVTTTTRSMRSGESEGHPYHFVTEADFNLEEMVEWAKEYNDNLYGVTVEELERVQQLPGVGVWKLEYKGVMAAREKFPEMVSILITAPEAVLEDRIRRRDTASDEHIRKRMEYTREWLQHTDIYDYIVENTEGELHKTIEEVMDILRKEQYL
tara:strand:- start:3485 stop:4039 length:555 start_codon:yes stop_codon:yes gene_type:complete